MRNFLDTTRNSTCLQLFNLSTFILISTRYSYIIKNNIFHQVPRIELSVATFLERVCKHHIIITHVYKYNFILLQTQNSFVMFVYVYIYKCFLTYLYSTKVASIQFFHFALLHISLCHISYDQHNPENFSPRLYTSITAFIWENPN